MGGGVATAVVATAEADRSLVATAAAALSLATAVERTGAKALGSTSWESKVAVMMVVGWSYPHRSRSWSRCQL